MPKTDYYNDPKAPEANSIVVAVAVAVQDEQDRILLIKRSDNALWALPGGAQDIGETVTQAAAREVHEETGLDVEVINLSGIYSDPNHVIAYDDGEVRQEFSLCFRARPTGGTPRTSSESSEVRWFELSELDELDIHPTMRLRISHAAESRTSTYLG
ncbi:NUDIX hydrolase [Actinoallomurus rhizosphaericola]|uniref:NUDIX hydrolase n=1 Tax=Actinoallomurus rhizosphaericola TaxID=2952536 RepID=UPI00209075D9|nr:NUDIX domain-containing protein [Actinoallomurus rhizosphaericola]MCO5992679.1 NUDIX domain-containing protein [Actinoallomurus rhizosphaericola]